MGTSLFAMNAAKKTTSMASNVPTMKFAIIPIGMRTMRNTLLMNTFTARIAGGNICATFVNRYTTANITMFARIATRLSAAIVRRKDLKVAGKIMLQNSVFV